MGVGPSLKAVGYWRVPGARQWPRPQWLVRPGWRGEERESIAAYLRSGHVFVGWLGYSFCRFGCGIDCSLMGSCDLTDVEWVWPQGLAHYVEAHAVELPEELFNRMRGHHWRVPDLDGIREVGCHAALATFDFSFWEAWARQHQRRPWYHFW